MNRRELLTLGVSFLALGPTRALAGTSCAPTYGGTICTSEVDFGSFYQGAFQHQYQSQWCWAACISMVFSYYGHPVAQARIVSEVYGSPVNMPAMAGIVMATQLNRRWVDDRGRAFTARLTAAYDADAGVNAISNAWILGELDRGHPIIMGAFGHALVLTALQYLPTPWGPNIVGGGAFDPWPGRGARPLSPGELVPVHSGGGLRFVATVSVT